MSWFVPGAVFFVLIIREAVYTTRKVGRNACFGQQQRLMEFCGVSTRLTTIQTTRPR